MTFTSPQSSAIEEAGVGDAWSSSPVSRVVDIEGIPISGLLLEAPEPRAVIVALHGGAAFSAYWDCPGHPELSMMRAAALRGYTVLALDRPGYGASRPFAEELRDAQRRADLTYAAVDAVLGPSACRTGLFLWGHSVGSELAVRMATDDHGHELLGLEISGTGREHHALAAGILGTRERYAQAKGVGELIWTPTDLYPPDVVGGAAIGSRTPDYEADVTAIWPTETFPPLAERVRVPVHYTAGEYEKVWRSDPQALDDVAAMFTASPRVATDRIMRGGHNLSICNVAPEYHHTVMNFIDSLVERAHQDKDE
ncbi:alpha/beta hydrolase [Rhodococcus sp. SJ-3]|uniref:alpha/beta hydrolase n=1 Tax=Rhodococcus sp. SJ-3 TaxID=3454628 RepID=UPI003F79082F